MIRILPMVPASTQRENLRELIHNHIKFIVNNLGMPGNEQIKNNEQLVKSVRI
jgi:hypothetical protein